MTLAAFSDYERHKDNRIRYEYPNGYGKHKKKVILTVCLGELVAEVYLDEINFLLIDAGNLTLLESNPFIAHKRHDNQLCGRANGASRAYIHRMILKPSNSSQVDHINHNPLDNRISNLRECSAKQNNIAKRDSRVNGMTNTQFRGVIHINEQYDVPAIYKVRHPESGTYSTSFTCEWEAAEFRDDVIAKHFFSEDNGGTWPTINFIIWNTDTRCNELIEHDSKSYNHYMENESEETLASGIKWLSLQDWAKPFYDAYYQEYEDEVNFP